MPANTSPPEPDGPPEPGGAAGGDRERRRVRIVKGGPMLVEGPVEVVLDDGSTAVSDRWLVALCTCRRSRSYPFCDTSHRCRVRASRTTPEDTPEDDGT
ncbi:CDGSH iron-sulfur domain-containing protein [Actinomadura sp. BRA 177]|uniref:CDGSH iron-sulfur domain-containing protein n=1 Tax=Actinomadura sp. BRA 177 TaxID=2745202 RepID=UPI001595E053|nr:CDGSH iron-sulfur domain-containing protein [Actinomadura sp. BRA 177]NVI90720.1 CDGSH iron-sulfur domain-containing protein [Actinomadura sp. BRA 177]